MSSTFDFLKIYFSPFKRPKISFYIGEVAIGTPYFYPRNWIKVDGGHIAVPKKIGFDFVPLGWKTKWSEDDIRFEYFPVWSFVFFKWQLAIVFSNEYVDHYWECWLIYHLRTDKTKNVKDRIKQAKRIFPCKWSSGGEITICYWDYILKNKYNAK